MERVNLSDKGTVRFGSAGPVCPLHTFPASNTFWRARLSEPDVVCWFSRSQQISFPSTYSVSP